MQKNTKHDMGTTDKVALPNANMEEECNASTSRHGHMGGAGSGRPLGLAQPLLTDLSSSIYLLLYPAAAAPQQADSKRQGRQQLFPCYSLTGRETRKAERCVVKHGMGRPPTLCFHCTLRPVPVRALPLVLVRASVSGWTMVSPHACM